MEKIIVHSVNKTDAKNKFALFIGRWQPFHPGHQWLIDQKLDKGTNVCIAIRDTPLDEKSPWPAEEIKTNLEKRFQELIAIGAIKVIIIPDIESVNIGRGIGYDIIEHVPPTEIEEISATKIRQQMKTDETKK